MPNNSTPPSLFRDAAIQDMMGKPPGWLLHSGLTAIALVFMVVLGLTALIRYPERVDAPFLLQTEKIPLALYAGAGNVIDTVFAPSGAAVVAGDTLLVFRSETDWKPLSILDQWLTEVESNLHLAEGDFKVAMLMNEAMFPAMEYDRYPADASQLIALPHLTSPRGRNHAISRFASYPATIQQPYTTLRALSSAHASYQQTNGLKEETAALKREIEDANRLSTSLNRQVSLYDRELDFQQKNADRMNDLAVDGIVSTQEAEQVAAQTITARRQREVLVSSDIQNQLRVQQLRQQILQKNLAHREQLADFDRQLQTQLKLLRSALEEYRNRYFLIAREAGTLNWQPSVREAATVSTTVPIGFLRGDGDAETLVARVQLPASGQGKITVGDRAILDFAAYPSREFGQVEGVLSALDPVAQPDQEGNYLRLATIALPDTLRTSYGKTLSFQYNLTGTASIITAERTLLARILDQFLNLTKNT